MGRPNCRRRNGGYETSKAVTKPKRSLHDWITVTKPTYVYLDILSGYLAYDGSNGRAQREALSSARSRAAARGSAPQPDRQLCHKRHGRLPQVTIVFSITGVDSCNGSPTLVTVVSCRQLSTSTRRLHDLEANCRLTIISSQTHVLEAGQLYPMSASFLAAAARRAIDASSPTWTLAGWIAATPEITEALAGAMLKSRPAHETELQFHQRVGGLSSRSSSKR